MKNPDRFEQRFGFVAVFDTRKQKRRPLAKHLANNQKFMEKHGFILLEKPEPPVFIVGYECDTLDVESIKREIEAGRAFIINLLTPLVSLVSYFTEFIVLPVALTCSKACFILSTPILPYASNICNTVAISFD